MYDQQLLLKAIFYTTYIDNPNLNSNLIKNIDGKYYKLYINNKWSGRVTKFTILNKFLKRIIDIKKSKYINKNCKNWCKYWYNLYITNDKQMENFLKNKNTVKGGGGRYFYKFILDDIMLAIDGGKEAVKDFNIFGMIPYEKYVETHCKKELISAKKEADYLEEQEKKIEKQNEMKKLNDQLDCERRRLENLYFKNGKTLQIATHSKIDNIISDTDMNDNESILEMEDSIYLIMEKLTNSEKIQRDLYYYLQGKYPGISFSDVYKKLDY